MNNESNLRILGRLNVKPYYPKELAAELEVSDQFIVRRLKTMEEYGIVEGKWEREGSRKVKRYYPKDVTMYLGKDGLEVVSKEAPKKIGLDIKKEFIGLLLKIPLIVFITYGVWYGIPIVIATACVLLIWLAINNLAFYRTYRLKTPIVTIPVVALAVIMLLTVFVKHIVENSLYTNLFSIATNVMLIALIILIIYQYRYYQIEVEDMNRYTIEFISGIDPAPFYIKIFYLPITFKWKLYEYFRLV